MAQTRYRLALAATARDMPDIASALSSQFPELAAAIEAQWLEILNSGVNVFGDYEHTASERIAGLASGQIVLMTGIAD